MASLKDMRVRLASTKATQKITKAMQMVAASKLRRAQAAAEAARPFAERMDTVLGNIASSVAGLDSAPKLLRGTGDDKVHLLVVCTAERGLCGAFNSSIVRLARERANALANEGKTVKFICVGRKGFEQLRRLYERQIIEVIELRGVRNVGFAQAEMVAAKIIALFNEGAFDVCTLFYNEFRSVLLQKPSAQRLIPFAGAGAQKAPEQNNAKVEEGQKARPVSYEFEPDEDIILGQLLPRNLGVQIYRALLDSAAGEQAARMTAMDNATRNAGDMIKRLTLNYNRARQANITRELIEIISRAEAL